MAASRSAKRRLVNFPILEAGTVYWAAWADSTDIYQNGSKVVTAATEGSTGSIACAEGDVIRTFMDVGLQWNNVGMEILPSHWAYRRSAVYLNRYQPHVFYIWAKTGGTIDLRIGSHTNPTPDYSVTLVAGAVGTITDSSDDQWCVFTSEDTDFLVWRDGGTGDHIALHEPQREMFCWSNTGGVYVWGSQGYTSPGDPYYKANNRNETLNLGRIADGAGGDAEHATSLQELGDTYIVDHDLGDWWVGTIASTVITISSWNGSAWVPYTTYDLSTASRKNPLSASEGAASGSGATILTGPVKFEGTERFYLRCNTDSDDEYTVRGFLRPTGIHRVVKGGAG